ncbi:MAG: hypothetical protein QOG53_3471 [Frankiales bacterium]|nr:hypothetical protein [Frankiales bacterium]
MTDGTFLADFYGGSDACFSRNGASVTERSARWLTQATRFRMVSGGWELLRNDAVLARLKPGGKPKVPNTIAESEAEPPRITPAEGAALDLNPELLPRGATAARAETLIGTWLPDVARRPRITFKADGTYTGSDGCNGSRGAWAVGDGGQVVVTSGVSTLVGCENINVANWIAKAARAAIDGDTLVLYDARAQETHRVHRGVEPAPQPR